MLNIFLKQKQFLDIFYDKYINEEYFFHSKKADKTDYPLLLSNVKKKRKLFKTSVQDLFVFC